jgi:GT2 family glycosyltransferase
MLSLSGNVAIVVLHYGDVQDTWRCLDSLERLHSISHQVVVVDNGSSPAASPEIVRRYPRLHVIRRETNGGWAGGNNTGIRYALEQGAEHVVLLNNDTTVAPHLLDALLQAARGAPEFGILGPVISFMDEPDQVRTDGCMFAEPGRNGFFHRREVPLTAAGSSAITEIDIVNGCCMMVDARVFRTVGFIDERFFLVHEESDLCLRARRAGFRCGIIGEPLVWHKGSRSFETTGKPVQRYYDARNLFLLLRKHSRKLRSGDSWASSGSWRWHLEYMKYVYYRYCVERDTGRDETAWAVLEGIWDAWGGCFGSYVQRKRPGVRALRWLFEWWRRRRLTQQESAVRASAVH